MAEYRFRPKARAAISYGVDVVRVQFERMDPPSDLPCRGDQCCPSQADLRWRRVSAVVGQVRNFVRATR